MAMCGATTRYRNRHDLEGDWRESTDRFAGLLNSRRSHLKKASSRLNIFRKNWET